jgi:23S rRNA (cytidine1920-2'-O)/16S rRNA (cytidine1409-2'-O)-methyltransferase
LLVTRGLFPSREKARAALLAGEVKVQGQPVTKAGTLVARDVAIEVAAPARYVSRGGDKLAGAIADLSVDVSGRVALDAGASTGGFTDCLLKHGARHVVAVDVGYGQLAWSLRTDPRVTVLERCNLRYLTPAQLREALPPGVGEPDFATLDLSFIGLAKVLPTVRSLLQSGGQVLALVKPQFEVGRGQVGKRGVVRQPELHCKALTDVATAAMQEGFVVLGLTYSPLRGPEGNLEYFILLENRAAGQGHDLSEAGGLEKTGRPPISPADLGVAADAVVRAAWLHLEGE